jgi:hypothetical protein
MRRLPHLDLTRESEKLADVRADLVIVDESLILDFHGVQDGDLPHRAR